MPISSLITNSPEASLVWKGLGGHFDNLSQIICEFIDNSISSLISTNSTDCRIIIKIERETDIFKISIEDSGNGINDLNSAFSLGATQGDTVLNEHGYGMKHALASANPDNNNWMVFTRSIDEYNNRQFRKITSAYDFTNLECNTYDANDIESWPGEISSSGTFITFKCNQSLLNTLRKGIQGPANFALETLVELLAEDLGFIYSNHISGGITISIRFLEPAMQWVTKNVVQVLPIWADFYAPSRSTNPMLTNQNLGNGIVQLSYIYGKIENNQRYKRYYKANMSTLGVELRINGRVLSFNLFKEVWNIEKHNSYNGLLLVINIISNNRDALPTTRTSKNGIREGDEKYDNLLNWIRTTIPEPRNDLSLATREADLLDELGQLKETHIPDPKTVIREKSVYVNIGATIPADMYLSYSNGNNQEVILYEGKLNITSVKDVYQLRMYWDGCVNDQIRPTKGILIASEHPQSVIDLISITNTMQDANGNNYNFECKLWRDEGINFP